MPLRASGAAALGACVWCVRDAVFGWARRGFYLPLGSAFHLSSEKFPAMDSQHTNQLTHESGQTVSKEEGQLQSGTAPQGQLQPAPMCTKGQLQLGSSTSQLQPMTLIQASFSLVQTLQDSCSPIQPPRDSFNHIQILQACCNHKQYLQASCSHTQLSQTQDSCNRTIQ